MKKYTIVTSLFALLITGTTFVNAQNVTVTLTGTGIAGYSGDGGSCKLAQISGPKDICMDAAQNIYFVAKGNGMIKKISAQKGIITTIAGGGTSLADGVPATSAVITPNYLCISSSGDIYFTSDNRIRKIIAASGIITTIAGSTTAGYTGDGGLAIAATFNNLQGIAIDASNNIYVVDHNNHAVRKITAATGNITTIAGNGTPGNSGEGGPAVAAILHSPVCVALDATGDIFISDQSPNYPNYDNSVIKEIDNTGVITTIAGNTPGGTTFDVPATNATMGQITGLTVGPDDDVYCNEMSCSCRHMHHHHHDHDTLHLVGGNFYSQGYSDDVHSTLANMNIPYGLCVDMKGNVYVADSNNQRIRKIVPVTATPTFVFGRGQYIDAVVGTPYSLDSLLWVTDGTLSETVAWAVLTPPMHGTLTGFPTTGIANADNTTTKGTGMAYTALPSYGGGDFFRIVASNDAGLTDTITIYVGPNSTSAPLSIHNGTTPPVTINLFPNPASSTMNVEWSNLQTKNAVLVISDIADRTYYKTTLPNSGNGNGSIHIDISSLPAGAYFVSINGTDMKKFVKE